MDVDAGELLYRALGSFLPALSSDQLRAIGRKSLSAIRELLRGQGLGSDDSDDAFQIFLINAHNHLRRHGPEGMNKPEEYLMAIARNAARRHLRELFGTKAVPRPHEDSLNELMQGDAAFDLAALPDLAQSPDELEELLLGSIRQLKGRPRKFAERHILLQQGREQIQREMHLPNRRAYARLQRQTMDLLNKILQEILQDTTAYSFASAAMPSLHDWPVVAPNRRSRRRDDSPPA